MTATIRAFPRLHIGLLDLAGVTARKYGGAGFALDGMATEVTAKPSNETSISGLECLDGRARDDVLEVLTRIAAHLRGANAEIAVRLGAPQHVGLGSKTTLLLSVLQAFCLATGRDMDRNTLQRLSGRGGTSGVGISTFFDGGFIVDCGQACDLSPGFRPSSASRGHELPPVVTRLPVPEGWRFSIMLPPGARLCGQSEEDFFLSSAPVPEMDVLRSLALMYHGVVPAVLQGDIALLRRSLGELHHVGFKEKELSAQSAQVRQLYDQLWECQHCAVGLSSLGPVLYAVTDSDDPGATAAVRAACGVIRADFLGTFGGQNHGFEVVR